MSDVENKIIHHLQKPKKLSKITPYLKMNNKEV